MTITIKQTVPIITLITDFGVGDEYAGIMKGVILSLNHSVTIVDITHTIPPHDLVNAAYIVGYSYKYFPEGTIHVVVVDPGVGSCRSIVLIEKNGHLFIAPDNGVLTILVEDGDIGAIIRVNNDKWFLKPVSNTFHGRDIIAPVAAHISNGVDIREMGTPADKNSLFLLNIRKPEISEDGELVGIIIAVDRFGNLITNIDSKRLLSYLSGSEEKSHHFIVGGRKIDKLSSNYEHAGLHNPLAIIGSRGYLEIAVYRGSAELDIKAKKGDEIRIVKK